MLIILLLNVMEVISIKKQGIKRHMVLLSFAVLFTLCICGAVSAEDLSTTGGTESSSQIDNQTLIDPIIGVEVKYEYDSDKNITPEILVTDSTGTKINFTKTYSDAFKAYQVSFDYAGVVNGTKFNITVSAPGYISQMQQVSVFTSATNGSDPNYYANVIFNMNATANYKLGRIVTQKANQILNFTNADSVLAITTAGVPKLNGETSEDCIEGILNQANGALSYGKGNLLMLRQTANDPVDFAFITKKGTTLTAVIFRNGSSTPAYIGTISENMTHAQWNAYVNNVSAENGFSFASLANAWAAGAPNDVLREAAFHGHVCQGTLGGYTITRALMQYYPPVQATMGGPGSPGDITSYKILGVPGDSDDDAVMYFLDATPGKSGYVGYDTTSTGATVSMVGFIRWTDTTYKLVNNTDGTQSYVVNVPGTGTLIVMKYDRDANQQLFMAEKGITTFGSLEEIQFNSWIIQKILNNPISLVNVTMELQGLNETQYYYLIGTAANITFPTTANATNKGQTRFEMQEAHGLDIAYIQSLNLTNATRSNNTTANGTISYDAMKDIGKRAAELAKQIFKNEAGINLEKDDMDLVVLTSAGYVYLNGQTTEATWDGIFEVLGSRLSRSTLLPIHMGLWKPLWFTFVLRGQDGKNMSTVYLRYNPSNDTFFVGTYNDGKQVNDIGPAALNNATTVSNLGKYVIPDGNFFNIQSIANAWRNDPSFDQLVTFLFHDHACPGVQPGFFITDYIFQNYPLSGNQSYFWMASSIYCKDDSLIYLLGVSPGMGSYMNQRLTNDETASEYLPSGTEEGVVVVWDPDTNTGKAAIISYKWPTYNLAGLTTSEAQREAMISAFVSLYKGESSPYIATPMSIVTSEEKYITKEEFDLIKQGGTASASALSFLKSLPVRALSDLIPVEGGSEDGGSTDNGGTNNGGNNGGSTNNGGSHSNSASTVGVGAVAVTAAAEAAADSGSSAKAYEVSKNSSTKGGDNSGWYFYGLIGIFALGGLVGFGFLRGGLGGK
jgi:formylmethanofuran dehydrogenase subunit E-like metal-binding protein